MNDPDKFFDDLPLTSLTNLVPFDGPRLEIQLSIERLKKLFQEHPPLPCYDKN